MTSFPTIVLELQEEAGFVAKVANCWVIIKLWQIKQITRPDNNSLWWRKAAEAASGGGEGGAVKGLSTDEEIILF